MTTTMYEFGDEFNGPAGSPPDPDKWVFDIGRWPFNNEAETYVSSTRNCFQDGQGNLVIRATKDRSKSGKVVYHSARIKTLNKFSQYTGHFEARIKINSQHGLWPAWWVLPAALLWPEGGEIDMVEDYGWGWTETSVHTPGPPDNAAEMTNVYKDLQGDSNFHVYRMDWTPDLLTFSRDGTEYLSCSATHISNWCFGSGEPMYMILNLAVGGAAGDPSKSTYPADFVIDYVHVW